MGQQEIGSPQLIIDGHTIKAALFDLDGTLLTSQGHADPRTVDSIKRLRAASVLTGLCTGRGVANIEAHLEPWGLIGCLDAYVASGGVDIVDATLTKHERRALLAGAVIDTIIEHFADVPATPAVTIDGVVHALEASPTVRWFSERERMPYVVVPRQRLSCEGQPKLTFMLDPSHMNEVCAAAATLSPDLEASGHPTAPYLFEFTNPGVSKEAALAVLMGWHGWSLDELLVFGDEENDIGMLKAAGVGVAMANGCDAARSAADFVTHGNDENGIGAFIDRYLP